MPIGIDYTPAYEQGGGIGRYVRELVAALANHDAESAYRLFVMGATAKRFLPALPGPNFAWRPSRISAKWFARLWGRAHLPLPVQLWAGKLALYHATDFVLPPVRPQCKTVLTVHDLSFVRLPETASPSLRAYLNQVVPNSVQRADYVLADSQATKDDLITLYQTPASKIEVLYSGVNPLFAPVTDSAALQAVRAKYKLGDWPFILAVGTVQPRKNYQRLIEALPALPQDLHLVIAGGRGWLQGPIYAAVEALGLQARVHFIGFADDADLPALYSAAHIFAFPSLYEGFGLPILEAFACHTPVLTARVSSLAEVAGDAALIADPLSVEAIADGLLRLCEDSALRARLVAAGAQQTAKFRWETAAAQLRAVYRRLL
jgi:glycosyltransferase involved in cell wall biosynthesis